MKVTSLRPKAALPLPLPEPHPGLCPYHEPEPEPEPRARALARRRAHDPSPNRSPNPQPQPTPQLPPGDELKFRTAAGPYGLRVPEGVTPGRKLQVTVTVPEGFSKLLVVEGLTVNGTPCPTVEESQRAEEESQHGQSAPWAVPPLGSCASSGRAWAGTEWAALGSSALPGRRRPTVRPATSPGARASRLQSRRSRRL